MTAGKICYALLCLGLLSSCGFPPPAGYENTPTIRKERTELKDTLLRLLPPAEASLPAAQAEAQWLSDQAYKASADIARLNDTTLPGWLNNILVNGNMQDRGLCWHYQHDMYRELRRRPLQYFRIGCCVRDQAEGSEHNCVYISPAYSAWPHAVILDPWIWCGRLKIMPPGDYSTKRWQDAPHSVESLREIYPVGHKLPFEHWQLVKGRNNKYYGFYTREARESKQLDHMIENIRKSPR